MTLQREHWKPFIDGSVVASAGDDVISVENPATGVELASVESGTKADVDAAVAAARRSFVDEWREAKTLERIDCFYELADRIEETYDELVEIETLESGKPIKQSRNDVTNTANEFRFYGGAIDKFYGDAVRDTREQVLKKVYEPYGVVGVITPYNWPPIHVADFIAPALAAGNSVVYKPSPETPLSALRIAELSQEIFPTGVINVVPGGIEAGAALTEHDDVDMLAFTGSDVTGEKVLEAAAKNITPTMMELGGKNPALVFPEADIEKTVSGLIYNSFYNSGQACTNPERWLLHEDIHDEIVEKAIPAVESLVVGDGLDPKTDVGPQITAAQLDKFETAIELAIDQGASILAQASIPSDSSLANGHWAPPTILGNVTPEMDIANEEVFGPVAAVLPFEDEREAVEMANDTEYGLAASIWTTDVNRAHRVARDIDAGIITINHPIRGMQGLPFGGNNRSGIGRKKAFIETLQAYARSKSIQMDLTDDLFPLSYGNR